MLQFTANARKLHRARRVAIVHDWLVVYCGAERVLRALLALFPDADLFAVVDFLNDADRACLFGKRARTTFIQNLPFARTRYRAYLPLMPMAIEQLDLSGYDLVISSSHAVAKGVITGPDQEHICYCHSPMRYAWDLQHQYLQQSGLTHGLKSAVARLMLHYMRVWDVRTANGVDRFIANSNYIAGRIRKIYGREAMVIYPPVDTEAFTLWSAKEDFYVTASRLVPYKRVDLIIESFNAMPQHQLIVIGDGPEMKRLRKLAGGNVTFLGFQDSATLRDYLQRARAFIFAAEEDFGILKVEAQACGTPVIAYGKGGALDSVIGLDNGEGRAPTGVFFYTQSADAITAAVMHFESSRIDPHACRSWAENFSADLFEKSWQEIIPEREVYATN
jgi:glycosyltransferase involved in cell wall biosynthesis